MPQNCLVKPSLSKSKRLEQLQTPAASKAKSDLIILARPFTKLMVRAAANGASLYQWRKDRCRRSSSLYLKLESVSPFLKYCTPDRAVMTASTGSVLPRLGDPPLLPVAKPLCIAEVTEVTRGPVRNLDNIIFYNSQ